MFINLYVLQIFICTWKCSYMHLIICAALHFVGALSRKCFHCNAGSDSGNLDCWDGNKLLVCLFILLYIC